MLKGAALRRTARQLGFSPETRRWQTSLAGKYADRLQQKLKEEGAQDVAELKVKLEKEGKLVKEPKLVPQAPSFPGKLDDKPAKSVKIPEARNDNSPFKPLGSFLNLPALLKTPHTAEQISALWTVYHASRSSNTGRGYISAAVPLATYEAMLERARKYPMFVLPLPHPDETSLTTKGEQTPVEFHVLQWSFHPPTPLPVDPLEFPPSPPKTPTPPNPHVSTVIYTPLVQFKLHQSYATPYFIMTHYTEFAKSHGIVLLRGEITPSSTASVQSGDSGHGDGKFMLSQRDAQLLALGLQQFYLPVTAGDPKAQMKGAEAEELLRNFHEQPDAFKWESLLKFVDAGFVA